MQMEYKYFEQKNMHVFLSWPGLSFEWYINTLKRTMCNVNLFMFQANLKATLSVNVDNIGFICC